MKKTSLVILLILAFSSIALAADKGEGRKTVTTAGTAVALSATSQEVTQCDICAETDNTGTIAVGFSSPIAALSTRTGIPLAVGDCYSIQGSKADTLNLNEIYIDSTVSGDGVTYTWSY